MAFYDTLSFQKIFKDTEQEYMREEGKRRSMRKGLPKLCSLK